MSTLKTPEATLSYPHLFEPDNFGSTPKYSATFVFTPEAQETPEFKALKDAATEAAKERFGTKASKARSPFLEADTDEGWPEGSVYIRCRSSYAPKVFAKVDGGKRPLFAGDAEDIYPGCKVVGAVAPFAYDNETKGVSFALVGVLKVADGERLGGGGADFDALFGEDAEDDGDDLF